MGWFGDVFSKKKGGTFVGNLFRGVSSGLTGGLLGSGSGLAKWQAGEEQGEYETELQKLQSQLQQSKAYATGQGLAQNSGMSGTVQNAMYESPQAKELQNKSIQTWAKRNWYILVGAVGGVVGLTYLILGKRGNKRKVR